ncbi:MAG: glycosyltransferase [Eubacterium sp.]|nr:glycosyltransferase [Eubacterium sp.]
MKVSVCIPVYNGEKYITQAVESVLSQTYKDYELLIVDNHSTDHTLEKVTRFSDERIRLIKNDKNYGMLENWNICLRQARGEYIQILCADDFLEPECLEGKVRILEKYQDVVLVFGSSKVVNAEGKLILKRRPFHKNVISDGQKMAKRSFRTGNIYGEPSNVMFRRKAAEKAGEFSVTLCGSADWEFWIRLSLEGRTAYISRFFISFRISGSSATARLLKQIKVLTKDDIQFVKHVKRRMKKSVTGADVLIHYMAVSTRFIAKEVFCMVANR